jgi:hydrogenase expression/formation protein HypC
MCLGIPMQIKQINGGISATCEAKGVQREASLLLMMGENLNIGDYVMISMGNVISIINEQEAAEAWALYDEMFAQMDNPDQQ